MQFHKRSASSVCIIYLQYYYMTITVNLHYFVKTTVTKILGYFKFSHCLQVPLFHRFYLLGEQLLELVLSQHSAFNVISGHSIYKQSGEENIFVI